MNTVNFIVSALTLATAASAATPAEQVPIKDNANYVQELAKCDGNATITIKLDDQDVGALPFLFPKVNEGDKFTFTSAQTPAGNQTSLSHTSFPGHFAIPSEKIKALVYTGNSTAAPQFFVIPPEVGVLADGKEAPAKSFVVTVDYMCKDAALSGFPKSYNYTVTNNARAVSLFSSAAVLAASLLFVL